MLALLYLSCTSSRPSPETQIARYRHTGIQDADAVLNYLRNMQAPQIGERLAAPLVPETGPAGTAVSGFSVRRNGLVNTIVEAYSHHHAHSYSDQTIYGYAFSHSSTSS